MITHERISGLVSVAQQVCCVPCSRAERIMSESTRVLEDSLLCPLSFALVVKPPGVRPFSLQTLHFSLSLSLSHRSAICCFFLFRDRGCLFARSLHPFAREPAHTSVGSVGFFLNISKLRCTSCTTLAPVTRQVHFSPLCL